MKINTFILNSLICGALFSITHAYAGEAKVNWIEPNTYTDIRPGDEPRKRFEKRVFSELETYIGELAATLPDGQTLQMDVTNLDLAGDVRYMVGPNNATVRVIEDLYFPKMRFRYQLTDASGEVLKQGEEKLKDMGFFNSPKRSMRHENFSYEKAMIGEWFEQTFSDGK
ncbi:DUF3016 domain-containing protein [Thalassotalea ponticola]|uniref:DUF3016 domain-containing protein n=1 Tax=Thalassotalea ponticola TaxID=1523392 RepID=UPI0025B4C429|nr:DUF3016 domain-containing protein [Thalassotalea ponticola]MDN3653708.1 DUF3016 domain-containing protein [Thalassotalea ponticola]